MLPVFYVIVLSNLKIFSGIISLTRLPMPLVWMSALVQWMAGLWLVSWLSCHTHYLFSFLTVGYGIISIWHSVLDIPLGNLLIVFFLLLIFSPLKKCKFLWRIFMFLTFLLILFVLPLSGSLCMLCVPLLSLGPLEVNLPLFLVSCGSLIQHFPVCIWVELF